MTLNLNPSQNPIPVPVVSAEGEGVMTPEMLAQLQAAIAIVDTIIYVSTMGSDSNPGTQELPLATPDAAFALLPALWNKSMVMSFGPGTFTFSGKFLWVGSPVGPGASPLQILGTPVSVNDTAGNALDTMTASGGTTDTSIVAATPTTTDDDYRGAFLRNLTTGGRITVTGNTFSAGHTTFTVLESDDAFTASAGDEFTVEIPGTIFQAEPDESIILYPVGGGGTAFGMRDIAFQDNADTSTGTAPLLFTSGFNFAEAVQTNGGPFFRVWDVLHGSRLNAVSENSFWRDAPIAPFDALRSFAGLYLNSLIMAVGDRCALSATVVMDETFLQVDSDCNVTLNSLDSDSANIVIGNSTQLFVSAGSMRNALDSFPGAIWGFNYADIQLGFSDAGVDISDSAGDGVTIDYGSQLNAYILTGTGNAGAGISLQRCSQAITDTNGVPGSTSITGTTGDVLVGADVKTYGDLPYSEVNASGPTLNRAEPNQ